jgi:hypothetical protein
LFGVRVALGKSRPAPLQIKVDFFQRRIARLLGHAPILFGALVTERSISVSLLQHDAPRFVVCGLITTPAKYHPGEGGSASKDIPHQNLGAPKSRHGHTSAFTRVFDALWRCSVSVLEPEPGWLRTRGPLFPSSISAKLRSLLRLLLLLGVVPLRPRVASAGLTEIDAVARLPAKRLDLGGEGGGTRTALTGNFRHCTAPFSLLGETRATAHRSAMQRRKRRR